MVENHTTLHEAGDRCRPRRGGDRLALRVLFATRQGTEGSTAGAVSGSHARSLTAPDYLTANATEPSGLEAARG
jgi:hypothetical protein